MSLISTTTESSAPGDAIPRRRNWFGNLSLVVLIGVLAVVPLGLFAAHVFDQRDDLRERNLRSLAKAAIDVTNMLSNARKVVANLQRDPEFACELDKRQPFLSLVPSCSSDGTRAPEDPAEKTASKEVVLSAEARSLVISQGRNQFLVRLEKMLAELPATDEIDLLLVVREDGRVEASHSSRTGIGVGLNSLSALTGRADDAEVLDTGATLVKQVLLSGRAFDLLCQPFQIETDHATRPLPLAMCGLVDAGRVMREALTVTPGLVIVLFAVVVLGVLCWPMLKIFLLTERERFRFTDLYFVLFGTWSALMVVAVVVLGSATYFQLERKTESSLEDTAEAVDKRLTRELKALHDELHEFEKRFMSAPAAVRCDLGPGADGGLPAGRDRQCGARLLLEDWAPSVATDFEIAFWVDPETGNQLYKTTVWNENTPLVFLGDRDYFTTVRDARMWEVGAARWYVENVRSKTTTAVRTMLATRSSFCVAGKKLAACADAEAPRAVLGGQTRLISVNDAVLSPGVGFAVIDESGRAVFHSDPRRVLKDNFFAELPEGDRLHAAAAPRAARHLELDYLGRPHQFFVMPMAELPWTVVVFSDNDIKRTFHVEAVGHALLLSALFVLLNLIGTLGYLAIEGQDVPRWFWPTQRSSNYHQLWSAGLVVVLVLFLCAIALTTATSRLIVCALVPMLIVSMVLLTSRLSWGSIPERYALSYPRLSAIRLGRRETRLSPRTWYVIASGLLWVTVAVLPAAGFYSNALSAAAAEFVKQENVYHGASLERRYCAMGNYYRNVPSTCDESTAADDMAARCECRRGSACRDDIYRSSLYAGSTRADKVVNDAGEVVNALAPQEVSVFWSWSAQYKPLYSDSALRGRYLYQQQPQLWREADEQLWYQHPYPLCGPAESFSSVVPVDTPDPNSPFVWVAGLLLLVLGYGWLRYVASTLYFYAIEPQGRPTRADVMGADGRVIAFVADARDRAFLLEDDGSGLTTLALAQPLDDEGIRWLNALVDSESRILIVASFDLRLQFSAVPDGVALKWVPHRGNATSSPLRLGGDYWRRHKNALIGDDWIKRELDCGLEHLRGELGLGGSDAEAVTKVEAQARLCDLADDHYQALWRQCSNDERQVLVQLVEEAVVNPKQAATIRRLLRRGLIRRNPALRTFNDSFAMWIENVASREDTTAWEHSASGMQWSQIRWIIVGILVFTFAFLWFTQRHVVETGIAFLSVVGVAIPTLLRLLTSVKSFGAQGDSVD